MLATKPCRIFEEELASFPLPGPWGFSCGEMGTCSPACGCLGWQQQALGGFSRSLLHPWAPARKNMNSREHCLYRVRWSNTSLLMVWAGRITLDPVRPTKRLSSRLILAIHKCEMSSLFFQVALVGQGTRSSPPAGDAFHLQVPLSLCLHKGHLEDWFPRWRNSYRSRRWKKCSPSLSWGGAIP